MRRKRKPRTGCTIAEKALPHRHKWWHRSQPTKLPARGAGGEVFLPHAMAPGILETRWGGCSGKACQPGRRLRGVLSIRVR